MFFALNTVGETIEPSPGMRAICPLCRGPVNAKCGKLVEWHWAHLQGGDCDPWAESETPWHRWWKERAPASWREVTVGEEHKHRADIRRDDDEYVIELQHSHIPVDQIREREAFYRRMVWLLDCRLLSRDAYLFDEWVDRFRRVKPGCWAWLWPRKSFMAARKRVFLDLGRTVVEVKEFREVLRGSPSHDGLAPGFYVYGEETSRNQFLRRARLRPVDGVERDAAVSLIAEWRVLSRPHDLTRDLNQEVLRRREFRSVEAFRR